VSPVLLYAYVRPDLGLGAFSKVILYFLFLAGIGTTWPVLLGGQAHWTVGLVATLISMSSIIAADTYAFIGGKVLDCCSAKFYFLLEC